MKRSAPYLSNHALECELNAVIRKEDTATAVVLDHVAEYDARKLYLPAGYPSMFAYCVGKLRRSEGAAFKRIRVARAAQRFPAILDFVADGRLHLSAVVLLAPHLTKDTAEELLAAATHKTKLEIEQLLAERFPRPDLPTRLQAIPPTAPAPAGSAPAGPVADQPELSPGTVGVPPAPSVAEERPRVQPLAPQRFALQVTIDQETHDDLRYAQDLLGHELPSGDVATVLALALKALIPQLEKRKFSATVRPRPGRAQSRPNPRYIPPEVKRAVWKRDGGRCTFVGESGHRCAESKSVEFDHVLEVARGGEASVPGIRLRCRAHNQYSAECTFGAGFMCHKRLEAAEAQAAKAHAQAERPARARDMPAACESTAHQGAGMQAAGAEPSELDVVPWLRALGFRTDEARRAAAHCDDIPHASLEERVRRALSFLAPPHRRLSAT